MTSAQILNDVDRPLTVVQCSLAAADRGALAKSWSTQDALVAIATRKSLGPPSMREQFGRIQRIRFNRSFDECVARVGDYFDSLREIDDAPQAARERQRQ